MHNFLQQHFEHKLSATEIDALIFALRSGIGCALVTYLAFLLELPSPYWAVISIIVTMSPYAGASIKKGLHRILGTLVGVITGLLITMLVKESLTLLLLATFLVTLTGYYYTLNSKYKYAVLIGTISSSMVIYSVLQGPDNVYYTVIWRFSEITLGVIVSLVVAIYIAPKDIDKLLEKKIDSGFMLYQKTLNQLISNLLLQEEGSYPTLYRIKINDYISALSSTYELYQKEVSHTGIDCIKAKTAYSCLTKLGRLINALLDEFDIHKESLAKIQGKTQYILLDQKIKEHISVLFNNINGILASIDCQSEGTLVNHNLFTETDHVLEQVELHLAALRHSSRFSSYSSTEKLILYSLLEYARLIMDELRPLNRLPGEYNTHQSTTLYKVRQTINTEHLKNAAKTAAAIVLATCIWLQLDWPGGMQGIITALVLGITPYMSPVTQLVKRRLLGCFIGAGVGLLALHFFIFNLYTLLLILGASIGFFSYINMAKERYNYIGLQANIAITLTLVHASVAPVTILPGLERLPGMLLGIILITLVNKLIGDDSPLGKLQRQEKEIRPLFFSFFSHMLNPAECHKLPSLYNNLKKTADNYILLANKISMEKHIPIDTMQGIHSSKEAIEHLTYHSYFIAHYINFTKAYDTSMSIDIQIEDLISHIQHMINELLTDSNGRSALALEHMNQKLHAKVLQVRKSGRTLDHSREDVIDFINLINHLLLLTKQNRLIKPTAIPC